MTDRLHHELVAVAGLEQVTALQLQELPWKTRELVFVGLFQEHASSVPVADELRLRGRDRRLERKTEKAENAERNIVRKSEERFRSEFMEVAATELARLGAPSMVTWQKLVFDRDCCLQAFRILLTKIKSAKRSASSFNNNGGSAGQPMRRSIQLAKRFSEATPEVEGRNVDDGERASVSNDTASGDLELATDTVLPRVLGPKSALKARRAPSRPLSKASTGSASDWNADTSVQNAGSCGEDDRHEDEAQAPFGSSEISIQRTKIKPVISASTASVVSKLKKGQLQSLQQENAALAHENAALRGEIAHLEEVVATLQAENNNAACESSESVHHARMKLLQAQNMQLQRQIKLLHDAMAERELAESMLLTSLSHWREVVESGRQEANAAGADENGKTKEGKPVQWMMAVPERLLEELARVESQIEHAMKTMSIAHEAKLRVGGTAAEFIRHSASSAVNYSDIYVPGIAHLRVERVKKLETALVQAVRALQSAYDHIVQVVVPTMGVGAREERNNPVQDWGRLLASLRALMVEVGAFGVVVPAVQRSQQSNPSDDGNLVTVAQVLRAYTAAASASSGVSVRDREKQLKAMLKQLQARESAAERDRCQLLKESQFWKNAWRMQEQLLHMLLQRVQQAGNKKMQWAESYLVHPLRELQEVWSSFQRTQAQQEQRIHKNAYLPLLIDTLQRHEPVVCLEAIDQWNQYTAKYNHEVDEILADYGANASLLKSYLGPAAADSPSRLWSTAT